jgi:ribokinase
VSPARVVVLGDVMVDVVTVHDGPIAPGSDTPSQIALRPGGAGANVAAWLARAGTGVALCGRTGDDALSRIALRDLDGVDLYVTPDPQHATGMCIVLVAPGGERTMLPDPGANDALAPADVPDDLLVEGGVLFVSGYTLLRPGSRPAALDAMARAREAGMRIAVDPASAAPLAADPAFLDRARPVDLLLPNALESEALGELRGVGEWVVTSGADGARWSDGARTASVRAVPVDDVVDTTGAGDAFAAGFLSCWPGPAEEALRAGVELAALAVAQPGGRPLR